MAAAQAQLETAQAIRAASLELNGASAVRDALPSVSGGAPTDHTPSPHGAAGRALDRFYAEALLQAKVWFVASVFAATVGLGLIVVQLLQANTQHGLDTSLKVASGVVAEAIAALFYRQADATRKHAADLLTSTQSDRRVETAIAVLKSIEDPARREDIAARLAVHFAGAPPAPKRRLASPTTVAPEDSKAV